jgi:hypothetical protein
MYAWLGFSCRLPHFVKRPPVQVVFRAAEDEPIPPLAMMVVRLGQAGSVWI